MSYPLRIGPTVPAPIRIDRRRPIAGRLDWVLLGAVIALAGLGALLVWAATRSSLQAAGADPQGYLLRHLLNTVIGVVLAAVATFVDYRALRAATPVLYLASCLGLLAVLAVGSTINGAHSWIVLGAGFQVQPSEFAKVGLILGVAMVFAERRSRAGPPDRREVAVLAALAAVPLLLVMAQPDLGTAMVLVVTVLGMLAIGGVPARWLVGLLVAGILAGVLAVVLGVLQPYQIDRFTAFLHPAADAQGTGYNTAQARIAIGSGGVTGSGLLRGSQTNGGFVPEQQTDFIFTVAGEELGLLGGLTIICLFGVVLWRGVSIAARAPDVYGRLVAGGVVSWFAFQGFVNIGMTLGICPVTGLPLPFVSYGGSSMFAAMLGIGLLQNIALRSSGGRG